MLTRRPPIVVILGHVDHGKTTLLDYLRSSNVASREAGGITQSIRSFQFQTKENNLITFIDTPGHAAFSAMRKRGSQVADIAVLVVAADDGVMPQTKESLEFIKSSRIPFIVAINKIDLPAADQDRIKTQLVESQVIVEELGGDVPVVSISAKSGKGTSELLEIISLITELNPPQSDPQGPLNLSVVESRLDSKKGPTAVVVVKNGTLTTGQELYQHQLIGKVKALTDPEGAKVTSAAPSQPVEILGLTLVPEVGSEISDHSLAQSPLVEQSNNQIINTEAKLNIILRADVAGSLEAILGSLPSEVSVLASGTGDITENDILQARPSQAIVIGFNVKLNQSITKLAQTEKVQVQNFRIIYELLDFIGQKIQPDTTQTITGKAKIIADFKIESERIAGCKCTEGSIEKSAQIQVHRQGKLVGETKIKSLRQGKNPTDKVKINAEFGVVFSPHIDFKVDDDIIATTG